MEELENGNTKTDEETHEIEPKNTPYGITDKENEDVNVDIFVNEAVADYTEPQLNDNTTEVVVENEMEADLEETNEVSVFPVAETKETMVLDTMDGNIGASSDIGTDRRFDSEVNIPRSENLKNVEDDRNNVIDMENRETDQPPISANPSLAQRTSWDGCCGLFEYLRRSGD